MLLWHWNVMCLDIHIYECLLRCWETLRCCGVIFHFGIIIHQGPPPTHSVLFVVLHRNYLGDSEKCKMLLKIKKLVTCDIRSVLTLSFWICLNWSNGTLSCVKDWSRTYRKEKCQRIAVILKGWTRYAVKLAEQFISIVYQS